jgi:ABC-2 type transport system permease protein
MGSTMGSYFGLLFLIASYTAIGIFTSTLSENQSVSFLVSVCLCFVFYYGFEGVATYMKGFEDLISSLGMDYHFKSMSRGVVDTRDVLYFISIAFLFLSFTVYKLKSLKS